MKSPEMLANLILNDLPSDSMEQQSRFLTHMVRDIQDEAMREGVDRIIAYGERLKVKELLDRAYRLINLIGTTGVERSDVLRLAEQWIEDSKKV